MSDGSLPLLICKPGHFHKKHPLNTKPCFGEVDLWKASGSTIFFHVLRIHTVIFICTQSTCLFFLPLSHFFSALMLLSAISLLNHMHLQAFQHSHQDCQKPLFHPSSSALTFPIPSTDVLQSLCVIVVVLQYSGINYSGIPCSATFTVINSLTFEVHISYFYRYEDFDAFLQSGCELSNIHTHTHAQFMWKLQYMPEGIT